jgi:uncharacterized protein RhaS with RHS repeats
MFRPYSSSLGRWLSRDPLGESMGTNLYAYVANSPTNASDPLGLGPELLLPIIARVAPWLLTAEGVGTTLFGMKLLSAAAGNETGPGYSAVESAAARAIGRAAVQEAVPCAKTVSVGGPNIFPSVPTKIGEFSPFVQETVRRIWNGELTANALPSIERQQLANMYSEVAASNPAGSAQAAFNQARADYLLGRGLNPGPSASAYGTANGFPLIRKGQ